MGSKADVYKRNVPWFLLGNIFSKAIVFILIPFYTNILTPEEYGLLSTYESLMRLVPLVFSLGLDAAFIRHYHTKKNSGLDVMVKMFSSYYWFVCLVGCLFIISSALFFCFTEERIHELALSLVIVSSLFTQLSLLTTLIWKSEVKAKPITIINCIVAIFSFLATVLFLFLDIGWLSRLYATLCVVSIQALGLFYYSYRKGWLNFSIDLGVVKEGLTYSLPLLPGLLSFWVVGFSDRVILVYYNLESQAGVLSLAAQLSIFIYMVQDSLSQVNAPVFLKRCEDDIRQAKNAQQSFLKLITFIMSLAVFIVILYSKELINLIASDDYKEAANIIFFFAIAQMFRGWYRVFAVILSYLKKVWILSVAAIVQCVVSVLLNFFLIPKFGMYGAAFSSLLSVSLYSFFIFYWSQKYMPLKVSFTLITKYLFFVSFIVFISLFLNFSIDGVWVSLLLKTMFLLVVIWVMVLNFGYSYRFIMGVIKSER